MSKNLSLPALIISSEIVLIPSIPELRPFADNYPIPAILSPRSDEHGDSYFAFATYLMLGNKRSYFSVAYELFKYRGNSITESTALSITTAPTSGPEIQQLFKKYPGLEAAYREVMVWKSGFFWQARLKEYLDWEMAIGSTYLKSLQEGVVTKTRDRLSRLGNLYDQNLAVMEESEELPTTEELTEAARGLKLLDDLARRSVNLPDRVTQSLIDQTVDVNVGGQIKFSADMLRERNRIAQEGLNDWKSQKQGWSSEGTSIAAYNLTEYSDDTIDGEWTEQTGQQESTE